jgi:hypothetical protein
VDANAIISSFIRASVTPREHATRITLHAPRTFLPLRHTPVTSVTTLTMNGEPLPVTGDDGAHTVYDVTPFGLERTDDLAWNGVITVEYQTGWEAGSEPDDILEATRLIEAWLTTSPEAGVTSESVDGVGSVTRGQTALDVPAAAANLLRKYVRYA